jgi:outer membrane murein-binding lipoprotein Lpp
MRVFASVISITALLSGCVPYPIYKTLQPAAQVTVLNATNQPLQQAEVTLISNAYPYGDEKGRATKPTQADGTTSFDSVREWRTEVVMLHGAEVFFWNWCIRKEGYVTYLTSHSSSKEFESNLVVRLEPGVSSQCPKSFR